jgi:hypothetical protein
MISPFFRRFFMITLMKKKALESYHYIKAQTNAIDNSKFVESEKVRRDLFFDEKGNPSQEFYNWWINNHAEEFRKAWYTSLCRKCSKVISCKDCLREFCQQFNESPETEEELNELFR